MESAPSSDTLGASSSEELQAPPLQIAWPSRHHDVRAWFGKYRGFQHSLRCLTIDTAVARPTADGPYPFHLRSIC